MQRILLAIAGVMALGFAAANLKSLSRRPSPSVLLSDLKLEQQADASGILGAPSKFKVTPQTVDYLTKLQKDGKVLIVDATGSIHIQ